MPESENVEVDEDTNALIYRGQRIETDAQLGSALRAAVLAYADARNADTDRAREKFDDVLFLSGACWARLGQTTTKEGERR